MGTWFGNWFGIGSGTAPPAVASDTIDESLVSLLLSSLSLTGLVSTRVYPEVAPQRSPLPFLVYEINGEPVARYLTGKVRTREARVTIDVVASTSAARRTISDIVVTLIDDFRGYIGGPTGVYVAETIYQGVDNDTVRLSDGTDRVARLASLSFVLRYSPPA
jgi:hypothetical protein